MYEVGDVVVLLDGRYNDHHMTGWCSIPMDGMVGKSFVIRKVRINPNFQDTYEYKLEGDSYGCWYDEEWLSSTCEQSTVSDDDIFKFLDEF